MLRFLSKKDQRIKIISNNSNRNLPASLNSGHYFATGDFLTWTSDDNILKKEMLQSLLDCIQETDSDIAFSNYDVIEADGEYRRTHIFGPVSSLPFGNSIGASFLYRKIVFTTLKGYNETIHTLEDYDFWIRAALKFKFNHLNRSLYSYRAHTNNLTSEIQKEPKLRESFNRKHMQMYKRLSDDLSWSELTEHFLGMVKGIKTWDWVFFRRNYELIVNDLKKFQKSIQANDQRDVLQMLDLILRHKILNSNFEKSHLRWIFWKRPTVFLDLHYSKKTSIKILKKLI